MTVKKLSEVMNHISDNLCENCKVRLKYKTGTELRKWCRRCIDVGERKRDQTPDQAEALIMSQVEPLYFQATIDDLEPDIREKLSKLQNGRDVFLFGPVGVGKTYTMAALIRHYVYQGFTCRRINFDDFCVEVRSTMSPASTQTELDLIKPLKDVDKLFIDDLGLRSKRETDFAYITLYSLINKRQEQALPTFVSTNKNIDQLGRSFDARVASRLKTALIIELKGNDKRKNQ